jgi:16S rRNA (cytidine1402-2'-O)-methyltransferase
VTAADPAVGGTLFVVATPIGNLADVTLRSLEVLRGVPLVAAEDTRMTRRLWARHAIETRLVSYHEHSPEQRETELIAHLSSGADLALVTDAGTPMVSDPGERLVAAWAERGGRIVPIPGASAVLAALVASALPAARWTFEGFLPRRGSQRRERLAGMARDSRTSVLFESPGRSAATLADLSAACGAGRRAALCRELTKRYEETWRGTLGELADRASARPPRGEVTIVVEGATGDDAGAAARTPADPDAARARVDELSAGGMTRSAAARQVAAETGLPRRDLFQRSE